jgi:Tfp pilus assembly protein PilV
MKLLAAMVITLSLLAPASAQTNQAVAASTQDSQAIRITRGGSQPSRQGPAENFTGSVRVDPLFQANPPSRMTGAYVTFGFVANVYSNAKVRGLMQKYE